MNAAFDPTPIYISLKTAFTATFITFFLGLAAARAMAGYRGRPKGLIDGVLLLPLVLPPSVLGLILLVLFGRNGPFGRVLLDFGITVVFSWPATVIASTVVAFPLMYKTAASAFEGMEPNLVEAARTLGASEWRIFWRVTLPLSRPAVVAGTSLAFARALGEFGATLMLAGNIPGVTQTLPVAIFFAVEGGAMQQAVEWTLIVVATALIVVAALGSWSRAGLVGRPAPPRASDLENPAADFTEQAQFLRPLGEWSAPLPAATGLEVEIEKRLPEFALKVAFTAGAEPTGLLGASGAGKTMTLRSIAGLEAPTRGRVVLNGRVLYDSASGVNLPSRARRVGLVFQNYALFPHLTAEQNIRFGLSGRDPAPTQRRVAELVRFFHLEGLEHRRPRQLSGGQQQRVALARALAPEPEALLLDEPLAALDSHLRSQMEMRLIRTLEGYRGVTLYVTHNLEEAYRISRRLVVLAAGGVEALGETEEVFRRPPSYVVARVTGCKNFSRARLRGDGRIEALDWGCALEVAQPPPAGLAFAGIRAHHLAFAESSGAPNTFPCWVVRSNATPFRTTLYLKLHEPPAGTDEHHLEAEVFKERWMELKEKPFPWHVRLDPWRLFLLRE